jgi:predicted HTH domain antitoxin
MNSRHPNQEFEPCYAGSVRISVELPDDLPAHANAGREALEALAIQGYRSGALTHHQAARLLEMSRLQFDAFLKDRGVLDHAYGREDLDQDLATLEQLDARHR